MPFLILCILQVLRWARVYAANAKWPPANKTSSNETIGTLLADIYAGGIRGAALTDCTEPSPPEGHARLELAE